MMSEIPLSFIPSSSSLGTRLLSCFLPLFGGSRKKGLLTEWAEEIRYRRDLKEFGQRDTDIWVSTYSRSGTTWMQMILYQLTQEGSMDFEHLFDVSPWVYYSSLRQKVPVSTPDPRILKTHDPYERFSHGQRGRYIFVVRDGRDVAVSWFHHRKNVRGYEGSFDQHFQEFLYGKKYNWFNHVRSWVENSKNLPLLLVYYEDLKNNFESEIRRIAKFLRLDPSEDVVTRTSERCSFAFMKEHEAQLGPHVSHFAHLLGSTFRIHNTESFLRNGMTGEGKQTLQPDQEQAYQRKFREVLGNLTQLERYSQES